MIPNIRGKSRNTQCTQDCLPLCMQYSISEKVKVRSGCQVLCLRGPEPWKPKSALLEHFLCSAMLCLNAIGGQLCLHWGLVVFSMHFQSSGKGPDHTASIKSAKLMDSSQLASVH